MRPMNWGWSIVLERRLPSECKVGEHGEVAFAEGGMFFELPAFLQFEVSSDRTKP